MADRVNRLFGKKCKRTKQIVVVIVVRITTTRKMSWEIVYSWSQIFVVVFAGLALVSGLVVNKRQAKQLVELETKLEQQREVTAKAEVRLEEIRQKQEPRTLDIEAFRSALKDKPKCDVQIVYQPNDNEAYLFANAIMLGLHDWARPSVPAPSSIEAITDEILESLDPRKDKPEEATSF